MQTCTRCGDFGILYLVANGEKTETLCYCGCDWSDLKGQIWKFPKLNKKIEESFEVSRCPLGWFLPDNERGNVPRHLFLASMAPIVERWSSRTKAAEKFWQEYGPIFEPHPTFWNEPREQE